MITMKIIKAFIMLFLFCLAGFAFGQYEKFENGLPDDPEFFPIAVWLQDPADAAAGDGGPAPQP